MSPTPPRVLRHSTSFFAQSSLARASVCFLLRARLRQLTAFARSLLLLSVY